MSTTQAVVQEFARTRLAALRRLSEIMLATNSEAESRRCAIAILKTPIPEDIDDVVSPPPAPFPSAPQPSSKPQDAQVRVLDSFNPIAPGSADLLKDITQQPLNPAPTLASLLRAATGAPNLFRPAMKHAARQARFISKKTARAPEQEHGPKGKESATRFERCAGA